VQNLSDMYFREDIQKLISYMPHIRNREAFALYAMHFIRAFALSLPGIFIPIFIFKLADKPSVFLNPFINNFFWVCAYYTVAAFVTFVCNMTLLNLVFTKLGFKKSILVSMIALAGVMGFLMMAEQHFYALAVVAVLSGVAVHFYWIPFHVFFMRKTQDGENFGEESALQLFVVLLAGALGPLIAGIIIEVFGFGPVFWLTMIFICIASIPVLLFVQDQRHRNHNASAICKTFFSKKRSRRVAYAFIGGAAEGQLYDICWSILLYFILADFIRMGSLVTLSILVSSLFVLWLGKMMEQKRLGNIGRLSVFVNAGLYAVRVFTKLPALAYGIDIVDRLNGKIYNVAYMTNSYDAAKEMGDSDTIIFREIMSHAAQVFAPIAAFVVIYMCANWQWVFALPAVFSLATLYIFKKNA